MMRAILTIALLIGFADAAFAATPVQFKTEKLARAHCKSQVVWFDPRSHSYYVRGTHSYGHTRGGAYTCRALAERAGVHAHKVPRRTGK